MFGFGLENYVMSVTDRRIGAFRATAWLTIIVTACLIVLSLFFFSHVTVTLATVGIILVAAVMGNVGLLSFNKGAQVGNIPVVVTISAAWGALTAVLSILLLGEHLLAMQALYITLIIIGTLLVCFRFGHAIKAMKKNARLGMEYAFLALVGWGAYFFLLSVLVKALGWFDAAVLLTIPTLLILLAYGEATKAKFKIHKGNVLPVLAIGFLNLIAFLSYNLGVSLNYTSIVAPIAAAGPVITITLAILILKEKVEKTQILGIALVILGLILLSA